MTGDAAQKEPRRVRYVTGHEGPGKTAFSVLMGLRGDALLTSPPTCPFWLHRSFAFSSTMSQPVYGQEGFLRRNSSVFSRAKWRA